jgi:hypothetical protein|tara:strand:- start:86 stop:382 length:297 start_codon:yes stop_codon:yes gene_type:complete
MTKMNLAEGVLDASDDDGWMAKEQLYKSAKYAIELHAMITDNQDLEPWIQAKITEAADRLSSVKHYMEYLNASDTSGMMAQPEMEAPVPAPMESATRK